MRTEYKAALLLLLLLIAACSRKPEGGASNNVQSDSGASNSAQTKGETPEFVEVGDETFEVRDRITLALAKDMHQKLPEEIKQWRSNYDICERKLSRKPCVFTDDFPLSEVTEELTESCVTRPYYSWVTPSEAAGGMEAVKLWQQRASSGEVFDCRGSDCKIIVYVGTSDPEATMLASCNIAMVGNVRGAPERCSTVAIISRDITLVEIIYAISQVACEIAPRRFNLMIVHPSTVSNIAIRNTLRNTLSNPPLSYAVESGQETIIGTASYRVSPILSPYREMVTARIQTQEGGETPRYFGIRISIDLYVNRYNTTRRRDWRLPDDQQEDKYEQTVKTLIKSSLESVCQIRYWRDETILLCDLPEDTPVDEMLRFYLR